MQFLLKLFPLVFLIFLILPRPGWAEWGGLRVATGLPGVLPAGYSESFQKQKNEAGHFPLQISGEAGDASGPLFWRSGFGLDYRHGEDKRTGLHARALADLAFAPGWNRLPLVPLVGAGLGFGMGFGASDLDERLTGTTGLVQLGAFGGLGLGLGKDQKIAAEIRGNWVLLFATEEETGASYYANALEVLVSLAWYAHI